MGRNFDYYSGLQLKSLRVSVRKVSVRDNLLHSVCLIKTKTTESPDFPMLKFLDGQALYVLYCNKYS